MSISKNSLWYLMCLLLSLNCGSTRSVNVHDISKLLVESNGFNRKMGHFSQLLNSGRKNQDKIPLRQERDLQEYGDYPFDKDLPELGKAELHLFSWWKGSNGKMNNGTPSSNLKSNPTNKLLAPDVPATVPPPGLTSPAGNINSSLDNKTSALNTNVGNATNTLGTTNSPSSSSVSTAAIGDANANSSGAVVSLSTDAAINLTTSLFTSTASTAPPSDTSSASTYLTTCYTVTDTCLPLITLVAAPICTSDSTSATTSATTILSILSNTTDLSTVSSTTPSLINDTTVAASIGNTSVTATMGANAALTGNTSATTLSLLQFPQQAIPNPFSFVNGSMVIPVYQVPPVTQLILLNTFPTEVPAVIANISGTEELQSHLKDNEYPSENVIDDQKNFLQEKIQHKDDDLNVIKSKTSDSGDTSIDSKNIYRDNNRKKIVSKVKKKGNSRQMAYSSENLISPDLAVNMVSDVTRRSGYKPISPEPNIKPNQQPELQQLYNNVERDKSPPKRDNFNDFKNIKTADSSTFNKFKGRVRDESGHHIFQTNDLLVTNNKLAEITSKKINFPTHTSNVNKNPSIINYKYKQQTVTEAELQSLPEVSIQKNSVNLIDQKPGNNAKKYLFPTSKSEISNNDDDSTKSQSIQKENSPNQNVSLFRKSLSFNEASFIPVNDQRFHSDKNGLSVTDLNNMEESVFLKNKINSSVNINKVKDENTNGFIDNSSFLNLVGNSERKVSDSTCSQSYTIANLRPLEEHPVYGIHNFLGNSLKTSKPGDIYTHNGNSLSSVGSKISDSSEKTYSTSLNPNFVNMALEQKPIDSLSTDYNKKNNKIKFSNYEGPNQSANIDKDQGVSVYFKYNDTFLAQQSKNGRNLIDMCKNVTCKGNDYLAQCCGQKNFPSSKCQGEDFSYLLPIPGDTTTSVKPNRQEKFNQMSINKGDSDLEVLNKLTNSSNVRVTRENGMNDFVKFQLMHGITAPDGKDLINALKEAKFQMQKVSKEFHPEMGSSNNIQLLHQIPIVERQIPSLKQSETVPPFIDTSKILENLRATITESLLQTKLRSNPMEKFRIIRNQGFIDPTDYVKENVILDKLREETEAELKRISELEMRRRQEEEIFNKEKESNLKELKAIRELIHRGYENQKVSDSEQRDILNYSEFLAPFENDEQNSKEGSYSKLVRQIGKSVNPNEAKDLIFDRYSEMKTSNVTNSQKPGSVSDVILFNENKFPELELKKSINEPNGVSFPVIKLDSVKDEFEDKKRLKRDSLGGKAERLDGNVYLKTENKKKSGTINDRIVQNFESLHDDLFGLQRYIASKVINEQDSAPSLQKVGTFVTKNNLSHLQENVPMSVTNYFL